MKKTVLITGATGYIGSMLTKYLCENKMLFEKQPEIIALVRNRTKAKEMLPEQVKIIETDILDKDALLNLKLERLDYLVHCASPTQSSYMVSNPVETSAVIVDGTRNILELAVRHKIESAVFLSSMEVYGKIDCPEDKTVSENEWGLLETMNARNSYSMGKRMAENLCYSYFLEYGVPIKVARLAQTFGRGVTKDDKRIYAQFAHSVKEGRDIVLHTDGESMGNYCDIQDVIEAVVLLLLQGNNGEAYNVVNEENTMTIKQMAGLVAKEVACGRISVVYDIPKENVYGYAQNTGLRLSADKLRKLGWKPKKKLAEMYNDMLKEMV